MKCIRNTLFILLFFGQSLVSMASSEKITDGSELLTFGFTPSWAPFNMYDKQGQLVGAKLDYAKLIADRMGMEMEVKVYSSWLELMKGIESGEVDLTLGGTSNPFWQKIAHISEPFVSYPIAVVTQDSDHFLYDLSFMEGKRIGVGKGYSAHHILKQYYPETIIAPVKTTYAGLDLLAEKELDAVVDILPVLIERLKLEAYDGLKVNGVFKETLDLKAIISIENAALLPEVNKAIASIERLQHQEIAKRWFSPIEEEGVNKTFFLIIPISILLMLIIAYKWLQTRKAHKLLQQKHDLDDLTKAYTRNYGHKRLEILKQQGATGYVTMIDLDYFKKINDRFGHDGGDRALKYLVTTIQQQLREEDCLCRWGGEEFLIINTGISSHGLESLLSRLRNQLDIPHIEFTEGLAFSSGSTRLNAKESIDEMIKKADVALYYAKENGRNQSHLYKDVKQQLGQSPKAMAN